MDPIRGLMIVGQSGPVDHRVIEHSTCTIILPVTAHQFDQQQDREEYEWYASLGISFNLIG